MENAEGLGNEILVSLTSVPGKIIKQILLEIMHMENKEVVGNSQQRGNHA